KGGNFLGVILNPTLTADKSKIQLKITEFGIYHAGYLTANIDKAPADKKVEETIKDATGTEYTPKAVPEPNEDPKDDGGDSGTVGGEVPVQKELGSFNILGFSTPTNQTAPTIGWTPSANADSYKLVIGSNVTCSNVHSSYDSIKATSKVISLADGTYFICVVAVLGNKDKP